MRRISLRRLEALLGRNHSLVRNPAGGNHAAAVKNPVRTITTQESGTLPVAITRGAPHFAYQGSV
jgi:hypothetical protein